MVEYDKLEYLKNLISEKIYEKKVILTKLRRINEEIVDLEKYKSRIECDLKLVDYQIKIFDTEREVLTNAN